MFRKVWYFVKLTRPLFLVGGVVLYLLGALVALAQGAHFHLWRLISGQALVTTIQLMTHYTNEYFDQEGDKLNTARTWFSGGSGVMAAGLVSPETTHRAAIALGALALIALVIAGWQVPAVLILGIISLLAAWAYSGPPFALVGTGWGELSASLVVALLVPMVGYLMQSGGSFNPVLLVVCLPLILIHLAMLIAFEIPDCPSDQAAGKRTFSVRFGEQAAARLHNLAIIGAFCVILGLSLARWPGAQLAWLTLPLAVFQSAIIRRYLGQARQRYLWLTLSALGLFAGTAFLWLAGFALLWMQRG